MADETNDSGLYVATVELPEVDTEVELEIPAGISRISLRPRTDVSIRLAFVTGKVATPTEAYLTFNQGNSINVDFASPLPAARSIFLATSSDTDPVVEILGVFK